MVFIITENRMEYNDFRNLCLTLLSLKIVQIIVTATSFPYIHRNECKIFDFVNREVVLYLVLAEEGMRIYEVVLNELGDHPALLRFMTR